MAHGRASEPVGHEPVMLEEVITALAPRPGGRYLDGTFGGGGHTTAILEANAPDGIVLAIDADPEAIERGRALTADPDFAERLRLVHGNFADLGSIASEQEMLSLDGVLLDLGLSSFQLDDPARGFAFRFDGPIDMRFDPTQGTPAGELVNSLPADELANLLWRYGDEQKSRRIAAAIERERLREPIETTGRLAAIVERAVGGRRGSDTHPATRTFQALRIAVNDELAILDRALVDAVELLRPGGRLVVIAFHSLEDRIVKQFMKRESATCICPPEQPICTCRHEASLRTIGRAQRPSSAEVGRNPRSRSAVLRVAERLDRPATVQRPN
jgi:16S rRNA (cytosine1402-N4)-methyltransferase